MVREEFLPLLAEQGLAADRPGLLGWSMGGLGVLMLGAELDRDAAGAGGQPRAVAGVRPGR